MKKNNLVFLVSAFCLALSACNSSSSSSHISNETMCLRASPLNPGIVGGQEVAPTSQLAHSLVFLIMRHGDEGVYLCTGSLISRDVILTAAHCVDDVEGNPSEMGVMFSLEPQCELSQSTSPVIHKVSAIKVNSTWHYSHKEGGDLALVKMESAAPEGFIPLPISEGYQELSPAEDVIVAGYGKTITDYNQEDKAPLLLRETHLHALGQEMKSSLVQELKKLGDEVQEQDLRSSDDRENIFFDQSHGHGVCAGDSGGPALLMQNGKLQIIGVASSVANPFSSDAKCGMLAIHTNVIVYRPWLVQTLSELEAQ